MVAMKHPQYRSWGDAQIILKCLVLMYKSAHKYELSNIASTWTLGILTKYFRMQLGQMARKIQTASLPKFAFEEFDQAMYIKWV